MWCPERSTYASSGDRNGELICGITRISVNGYDDRALCEGNYRHRSVYKEHREKTDKMHRESAASQEADRSKKLAAARRHKNYRP